MTGRSRRAAHRERLIAARLSLLLGLAGLSCAASAGRTTRQELEWFRAGPFLGASVGLSNADASARELDEDLAARGHTTTSSLDDTDQGWKAFAGYRFEQPFSLELGYVELGEITSTIQVTTGDVDAFLADVADVHPALGDGIYLAGQFSPLERGPVELGLRGGLWVWRTEVESQAAGVGTIDVEEDGIDPLLGVVFLLELSRFLELRLEYELFVLEDVEADFLSAGLQARLPR